MANDDNPYFPPGMLLHTMEKFAGLNTSTLRPGVPDEQCSWIDGFIPLDERNLRTLYSNGSAIYTPGGGHTIVCFYFANIASTPIAVVFVSDGSVVQINLNSNAATTILPAASILNPTITTVGITQWNEQYVIIVANQPNGYWLWDGLVFTAGTLSPVVTLTNPGAAYKTAPTIIVSGGSGTGASFVAVIAAGIVTDVILTSPGSGYQVGDTPTLTFSGGNSGGSGASLVAVMTNMAGGSGGAITLTFTLQGGGFYTVTGATITNGGSLYTSFTTVTVSGGTVFGGDNAVLSIGVVGGVITTVTVQHGGTYSGPPSATVTITDNGTWVVSSVTVSAGGSGYSPSTTLTVSGGSSAVAQATLRPVISGGVITSVTVLNGGSYAGNSPLPTIAVADTPVNATATISIMPFGIQGSAIESFSQRIWVVNGPHLYGTAPGSFTDFATSNGGVNQTSGDSFLRVGYTRLLNTNGFLFLIADSSVSYISGVQVTGSGPVTTTFTLQNADPEVGSPYPCSVIPFGREVMLANSIGIYAGYGGAFTKVSEDLDGVWNSVSNFGALSLSSAKATIFGRKVFMTLARIVDPVKGTTVNKLCMWDGKRWFASEQAVALIFINSNEINSVLTAYGTDGTSLYALFQTPSTSLTKTVQSKYWDNPGFIANKAPSRFWAMAKYYDVTSPNLTAKIDSVAVDVNGASQETSNSYTITGPGSTGYWVSPPEGVGQQGILNGMTISTTCKDVSLMAAAIANLDVAYRG